MNFVKLTQSIYNFNQQLKHSLALHHDNNSESSTSDSQMIVKIYLNFAFNAVSKGFDIIFCVLLFKIGGGLTLSYFPMVPLYLVQHAFRLLKGFYKEVEKFMKFRRFLRNIDENYPLVKYDEGHNEECAICKENMTQARKLPCNHAFHWFCIGQLIESGSKSCPICRAEFNNHNILRQQREPVNRGGAVNQRRGIFNLSLGRWLPNISIRFNRQPAVPRGPVIPIGEAIARVREIFPQLTDQQIEGEIRMARGHIDNAILRISEGIARGMY